MKTRIFSILLLKYIPTATNSFRIFKCIQFLFHRATLYTKCTVLQKWLSTSAFFFKNMCPFSLLSKTILVLRIKKCCQHSLKLGPTDIKLCSYLHISKRSISVNHFFNKFEVSQDIRNKGGSNKRTYQLWHFYLKIPAVQFKCNS